MRFNTLLSTLCLILVSSQVGEALVPAPSPSPTPAPAPAPGPVVGPSKSSSGLQVGFYIGKCAVAAVDVEAIIFAKIQQAFAKDPTLLPALLRLNFHDCFVTGCDASLLLSGLTSEQATEPNASVRGYEVIEAIKAAVEAECPGVVSCADIIAVSTANVLQLGGGPIIPVQTGRRDGLSSGAASVTLNLPSATMTVPEMGAFFALRGFTLRQTVALLGCHSVGVTHCKVIQPQLDPSNALFDALMDPNLLSVLQARCPSSLTPDVTVLLNQDPKNKNTVDNSYYNQIRKNRAVLHLDQLLGRHPSTSDIVLSFSLNITLFNEELTKAMIQLQAFKVLTGNDGNIRKVCSKLN